MLGAEIAHQIGPFSGRRDPDRAAPLAIGEAEHGTKLHRRARAHLGGQGLQRVKEAAAVGGCTVWRGLRSTALAGNADKELWAVFLRQFDPVGRLTTFPGCNA